MYAVYARKQLVDERTMRRWAWVHGKRVQQDVLKHELALAEATLILAGQPQDRQSRHNLHAPGRSEFVAAVRFLEARAAAAVVRERRQPANARSRRGATPVAPDVAGVRRRRDVYKAEIVRLEAEIQALSVPDAVELARAAEEATRSFDQQRDDAHAADRLARERHRSGRTPSPRTAEHAIQRGHQSHGESDMRKLPPARTPEQAARGEQPITAHA